MASNDDNNRNRDKHLFYLNELSDYKVKSDDPDVRGWDVKDIDNRVIGKVDNLLVNKNTERVVYLDVEVDKSIIEANHDPYRSSASEGVHEFMNKDGEEHIIIPIGLVNLNEDEKFVYTDKINHRTFAETKRIKKGSNVNREYETIVLESYNRDTHSSGDRNKPSVDKNAIAGDQRRTDLGDSDVSRTSSGLHNKDRESGQIDKDFDSSESKSTSSSNKTERESDLGKSRPETGATSGRDRENKDEEDFYTKKEFDDKNFKKRR
ncbi:MAG TPA: hypothetical protein VLO29_02605 [Salegentibacter sp.]|nr:hypothetical protein [Salegentibacter sp.]